MSDSHASGRTEAAPPGDGAIVNYDSITGTLSVIFGAASHLDTNEILEDLYLFFDGSALGRLVKLVDGLTAQTDKLALALDHNSTNLEKHAKYMRDTIVPAMTRLREVGDQLELMVPHETWPLPTYREMLFVK